MCIDDYEFRHFSSLKEKICKKFVVVSECEFARTYFVNIAQFEEKGQVALCKILLHLEKKGVAVKNKKFYMPKFNAIIEPLTFCHVQFEKLDEKQVIFKTYDANYSNDEIFREQSRENIKQQAIVQQQNYYCRFEEAEVTEFYELMHQKDYTDILDQQCTHEKSNSQSIENQSKEEIESESSHKKSKECERIIRQVIMAVKLWRNLYQSKKCSLTKASKIVGISKKSLDDYYLVLRIGQIHKFDFEKNLDKKMGDLRNFIKNCDLKVTGKLTKQVQTFNVVPNYDLDKIMNEYASIQE